MTILIIIAIFAVIVIFASSVAKNHEQVQAELASKMYGGKEDGRIENLASETERMRRLAEAMIQAKAAGHDDDYEAIMNGTYNGPLPEPRDDGGYLSIYDDLRILKIAGINYRQGIQTDFVRSLTDESFPYRCECHIYQAEDEDDGHKFFYGFVYIKRKDRGE